MLARTLETTLREVEAKISRTRAGLADALVERDQVASVRLKRELDLLRKIRDTGEDALLAVSMSNVAA